MNLVECFVFTTVLKLKITLNNENWSHFPFSVLIKSQNQNNNEKLLSWDFQLLAPLKLAISWSSEVFC